MNSKRVMSAVLCVAVAAGFAGCKGPSKKDISSIENTLGEYAEALQDCDPDAVLDLTDWDDGDDDCDDLMLAMYFDTQNKYAVEYYEEVASTITINYESDDIEVKDGKATIKVTYEIVDWEEVLEYLRENDITEIRKAVKNTDDTIKVKGKITLVKDGDEWKITKITNLDEVFGFIGIFREPDPTEPDPTETEPTETDPTGTVPTPTNPPAEYSYEKIVSAAFVQLWTDMSLIEDAELTFDKCINVYDLNQDGCIELIYLTADKYSNGEVFSAALNICIYNLGTGEYMNYIYIPGITYMAADGGSFIVFTTEDNCTVISYSGGEETDYHTDTIIYDCEWNWVGHYRRDERLEYDSDTDTEMYTTDYHTYSDEYSDRNSELTEAEYTKIVSSYIDNAAVVVARNYTPWKGDLEYGLLSVPEYEMMYTDEAITYLESSTEQ